MPVTATPWRMVPSTPARSAYLAWKSPVSWAARASSWARWASRGWAGSQRAPVGQAGVDRLGHVAGGLGGVRGLHVRDQMGGGGILILAVAAAAAVTAAGVAGLGDVHLVAVPEGVALDAPPGIEVIRRGDPRSARREPVAVLPPSDHLPSPLADDGEVVLHEHHPPHLNLPQPGPEPHA